MADATTTQAPTYTTTVGLNPILGDQTYGKILGQFQAPATGNFPLAQVGGSIPLGGAAQQALSTNFDNARDIYNRQNQTSWQRSYAPQEASLYNAQQNAQSQLGDQAMRFAMAQQQQANSQQNALYQQGLSSLGLLGGIIQPFLS